MINKTYTDSYRYSMLSARDLATYAKHLGRSNAVQMWNGADPDRVRNYTNAVVKQDTEHPDQREDYLALARAAYTEAIAKLKRSKAKGEFAEIKPSGLVGRCEERPVGTLFAIPGLAAA